MYDAIPKGFGPSMLVSCVIFVMAAMLLAVMLRRLEMEARMGRSAVFLLNKL